MEYCFEEERLKSICCSNQGPNEKCAVATSTCSREMGSEEAWYSEGSYCLWHFIGTEEYSFYAQLHANDPSVTATNIWDVSPYDTDWVLHALQGNHTVTYAGFCFRKLSAQQAKLLATFIKYNKNLEHLDFRHTEIESEGFDYIIDALKENHVQTIMSGIVQLTEKNLQSLIDFISTNNSIRGLDLQELVLTKELDPTNVAKLLCNALIWSPSITYFHAPNEIHTKLYEMLGSTQRKMDRPLVSKNATHQPANSTHNHDIPAGYTLL